VRRVRLGSGPFLGAIVCTLAWGFACEIPCEAATKTWAVSSGNWNVTTNWSPAVVPVAGDDVVIGHSLVGGPISVTVNANTANLRSMTVDPRAGAFAAGNITILVNRKINIVDTGGVGDLILRPDAGLTIDFQNSANNQALRVDKKIQIGVGYTPTGGTVNFATSSATNDMVFDFDLAATDATLEIGNNVNVTMVLTAVTTAGTDAFLSWISIASGSTLTVNCQNDTGVTDHYMRLTAEDAANPGRSLVHL